MICTTCFQPGCDSKHTALMQRVWKERLRRGLLAAARIAEAQAWGQAYKGFGPEQNLMELTKRLQQIAKD